MPDGILGILSGFILNFIENWGYLGIFVLMTIESASIPVPSEIIMPFAGFSSASGKLSLPLVILAGGLGNLVGSLITYFIAARYGEQGIRIISKIFLIDEKEIDWSEKWFQKFGLWSAFLGRLMPIVRTFISLPAGLFKIDLQKFAVLTLAGSIIWSAFLGYLGFVLGENWHSLDPYFKRFEYLFLGIIVVLVLWRLKRLFLK